MREKGKGIFQLNNLKSVKLVYCNMDLYSQVSLHKCWLTLACHANTKPITPKSWAMLSTAHRLDVTLVWNRFVRDLPAVSLQFKFPFPDTKTRLRTTALVDTDCHIMTPASYRCFDSPFIFGCINHHGLFSPPVDLAWLSKCDALCAVSVLYVAWQPHNGCV